MQNEPGRNHMAPSTGLPTLRSDSVVLNNKKTGDHRAMARILKGSGAAETLIVLLILNVSPSTGRKVKFCRREMKKRKSSIRANCSPGHILLPVKHNKHNF